MNFLDTCSTLGPGQAVLLLVALAIAFGFECVNGFHDTANAVATVIYTKSLKPTPAVVWSGIWNFIGVHAGGIGVAFSIVHLLPVDLLVDIHTGRGLAMVLALLLAAMIWNIATWYRGLPASSSHALIGSIMGVGMMNAWMEQGSPFKGLNWHKLTEVGLALVMSPVLGFGLAAALLLLCRRAIRLPALYEPPLAEVPPPWWIRVLLVGTCTGVSFAHGSNDGQKGMGLIMLVLIGIVPATFALDMHAPPTDVTRAVAAARTLVAELDKPELAMMVGALRDQHAATTRLERMTGPRSARAEASVEYDVVHVLVDPFEADDPVFATFNPLPVAQAVIATLDGLGRFGDLSPDDRWTVRTQLVELGLSVRMLLQEFGDRMSEDRRLVLRSVAGDLSKPVEYVPEWVVMGVALCLGLGTMVGWKRIVVTVGEKIGKTHLSYAQGGVAELVAAGTIGLADGFGLPVSTTHVLSSGVAGTMWANRSGIQASTVREIAAAWILTLPAVTLLAAAIYRLVATFVG